MITTDNIKSKFTSKESLSRYLSLTITLWVGFILSIFAFISVLQSDMDELKDEFFYESNFQSESLKNDFLTYQRSLELAKSFFESSDDVSNEEFYHFSKPLFNKGYFSNILWVDNKSDEFAVFCATKDGYKHFSKQHPNMSLSSYPEIISLIRETKKTKEPAISKNIKFLSDEFSSVALVYPVIKNGKMNGQIVGVLDLKKVFQQNFKIDEEKFNNLFIYSNEELVIRSESGKFIFQGSVISNVEDIIKKSAFYYDDGFSVLSDSWRVVFVPNSEYIFSSSGWSPWLILVLGITITFVAALFLFNLIGQNIKIKKAIQDATEDLKSSKKHTQSILNSVLEGIITINSKGIIQTFNPAAEKMFGYSKEEVIGEDIKMLMDGENQENHHHYIDNYLKTGEAKIIGIGREVQAKRKNGEMFPMGLGITEIYLDGEKTFVGIVRDITEEKEFQNRLEEARKNAENASKAKSEFLATMSHEIRTPMNGIIGVAELMTYTKIDATQEKYVNTIQSSGELLLSLINDVLDFSKIEAGELEFENIPVVLNGLSEEVMNLLNGKAHENNVELVLRIPQNIPLAVYSDPVRLRQVLINIIGNAIKFTKGGHVLLNIDKISQKDGVVKLRFEIKDTGVGIPKDKLDIIFEQFCQADSSTTREFGGTGLGLAICKKLIKMMGGDLKVDSVEGEGSNFWFEIAFDVAQDYTHVNISDSQELRDKKILVVDDYQINLEIFSEYLKNIGIKCDTAISPDKMFDLLEKAKKDGKPYDILVVDYYMPNLNGIEASKKVIKNKNLYGDPALILLTSLDRKFDSLGLKKIGFSGYLIKPVYPHNLISSLIYAFANHKEKNDENNPDFNVEPENEIKNKDSGSLSSFKARVMVVEDFEQNRQVISDMLEQIGCSVLISENGNKAIDLFKQKGQEIDVILMDCQMPDTDGFKATQEIRKLKNGEDVVIVALTANALQGDKEKCLTSGMNDYLSKPVKIKDLINIMKKYCNKSDAA